MSEQTNSQEKGKLIRKLVANDELEIPKSKKHIKHYYSVFPAEWESSKTSLASRAHFEALGLGLETQALGLGLEG